MAFIIVAIVSFNYIFENEGIYNINDYSTINNFSLFAHMGYSQEDDALTLKINEDGIEFTFTRGEQVVDGKVNNLGTTSIPEIESYISAGNGPLVYEDIDDYGRTFLSNLKKARNYTLNIKSNYVDRSFELTKKYTSTSYYQDYKDDQNDYGYIEENRGVYKLENQNGTINKTDKVKDEGTFLWASSLFKSFSDLDTSSLSGKKISPNTYTITDSTNKNLLCEIAGFGIYDLMFYLDKVTMTILDETTLSCQF